MQPTRLVLCAGFLVQTACSGMVEGEPFDRTPASPGESHLSPQRPVPAPESSGQPARAIPPDREIAPAKPISGPVGSASVPTSLQPSFAKVSPSVTRGLPLSGGTLLSLRDGSRILAADPDRDRLFLADLDTAKVLAEITLSPGDEPGRAVEDAQGRLHVVLRSGGAVATLAAGSVTIERRPVCPAPRGIATSLTGDVIFVACAGGELVALPAAGGDPLWTRQLARDLRDVVVDRAGQIFVSAFRSARLTVVDSNGEVQSEQMPPVALNLTRRGRAGTEGPAKTRFAPLVAWRMVAAPDRGVLLLHQRAFTGEVEAGAGNTNGARSLGGYGGFGQGCGEGIVQSVVSSLGGDRAPIDAPAIAALLLGIDLAIDRNGKRVAVVSPADAYVAGFGSLVITAPLEMATTPTESGCFLAESPVGPFPMPQAMRPSWYERDGNFAFGNRVSGEAVAVAFDRFDDVVLQMREPAELQVPKRGLRIALGSEPRGDVGQAIFHSNTGAGIACASCHPEGAEDGHTWRFVDLGARRTQSLRGGVSESLPLHWEGDMSDVAQIAREVFTGRMGGPVLTAAETTALTSWIDAIPHLPASPPKDVVAVARGKVIFEDATVGCASCHAGPRLTNHQTVDVGTGRALQVPSLRGVGARAPYMHTGCAPNLTARLEGECGGVRHGNTAGLSAAQAADLATYLESL